MLFERCLKGFVRIRLIIALAIVFSPGMLLADNHGDSAIAPGVMEIYECALINGATVDDVLKFGRGDFTEFAQGVGNEVRTFLWTPLAVAPPFQDPSLVRWVNHYPSWSEYDAGNTAWMSSDSAKLQKKLFSMISCNLPIYHQRHAVLRAEIERPARILIGRCEVNEGKDMTDVKRHTSPAQAQAIATALGIKRGQMLTTPRLGVDANLDFLNIIFANRKEMAKLQDAGRTGAIQEARRQMNQAPAPYACPIWDMHDSHYIYNSE